MLAAEEQQEALQMKQQHSKQPADVTAVAEADPEVAEPDPEVDTETPQPTKAQHGQYQDPTTGQPMVKHPKTEQFMYGTVEQLE